MNSQDLTFVYHLFICVPRFWQSHAANMNQCPEKLEAASDFCPNLWLSSIHDQLEWRSSQAPHWSKSTVGQMNYAPWLPIALTPFQAHPPLDALEFLRWLLMKILVTLSFLPYPSQGWEDTSILHNLMPSHIHARLLHPRSHLEQCDWHRNVLGDFRRQKDPCDDHWAPFQYLHPFLDAYSNKGNWRKRRQ